MAETRKYVAELIGTFLLVFVGTAAIASFGGAFTAGAAGVTATVGYLGIALAFGLTLVALVYAFGHISGAHLNPAVTIGMVVARRMEARDAAPYIIAQIIGAIFGSAVLWGIVQGIPGWTITSPGGLGANSYGTLAVGSAFLAEVVLTFVLVYTIIAVTSKHFPHANMAPMAIGFALLVIHLAGIGLSSAAVNPARAIGPALFVGGAAVDQLWLFIVAPIIGGVIAAGVHNYVVNPEENTTKAKAKTTSKA